MARGCCGRGRPRALESGPPICKSLEDRGGSFLVWPVPTASGLYLVLKIPVGRQIKQVDLFSFFNHVNCTGPTASWLKRELPSIRIAVDKNAQLFYGYTSTGISINKVAQISRRSTRVQTQT